MKKPLTVVRFSVPTNYADILFAMREVNASIVGVDIGGRQYREFLSAAVANQTPVEIAFTSQYGKEAKDNLDYFIAKLKAAGVRFDAARDLMALPHDATKVRLLLDLASPDVPGPSFVDVPAFADVA